MIGSYGIVNSMIRVVDRVSLYEPVLWLRDSGSAALEIIGI